MLRRGPAENPDFDFDSDVVPFAKGLSASSRLRRSISHRKTISTVSFSVELLKNF